MSRKISCGIVIVSTVSPQWVLMLWFSSDNGILAILDTFLKSYSFQSRWLGGIKWLLRKTVGDSRLPPTDTIIHLPLWISVLYLCVDKLCGLSSGVSPYATQLTKQRKQQKESYGKHKTLAFCINVGLEEVLSVLVSNVNRVH